jgi:hypothetical protein
MNEIGDLAREILLQAADDPAGSIQVTGAMGWTFTVSTNGQEWKAEKEPRRQADLEAAIEELHSRSLIGDTGTKGEVFKVTKAGYQMADSLK